MKPTCSTPSTTLGLLCTMEMVFPRFVHFSLGIEVYCIYFVSLLVVFVPKLGTFGIPQGGDLLLLLLALIYR